MHIVVKKLPSGHRAYCQANPSYACDYPQCNDPLAAATDLARALLGNNIEVTQLATGHYATFVTFNEDFEPVLPKPMPKIAFLTQEGISEAFALTRKGLGVVNGITYPTRDRPEVVSLYERLDVLAHRLSLAVDRLQLLSLSEEELANGAQAIVSQAHFGIYELWNFFYQAGYKGALPDEIPELLQNLGDDLVFEASSNAALQLDAEKRSSAAFCLLDSVIEALKDIRDEF
jgi:hypothetical protein